jgi:hypothetical protein
MHDIAEDETQPGIGANGGEARGDAIRLPDLRASLLREARGLRHATGQLADEEEAGHDPPAQRVFFSEEKKQKTFALWHVCPPGHVRQGSKVFWFFFSKKNILLPIRHGPP